MHTVMVPYIVLIDVFVVDGGAACWTRRDHALVNDFAPMPCYEMETAMEKCAQTSDCGAIAQQNNICGGKYRVSHGGPTIKSYTPDDKTGPLHIYLLNRSCWEPNSKLLSDFV